MKLGSVGGEDEARGSRRLGRRVGVCGWPMALWCHFESGCSLSTCSFPDTVQMCFQGFCVFVPLMPHKSIIKPSSLHRLGNRGSERGRHLRRATQLTNGGGRKVDRGTQTPLAPGQGLSCGEEAHWGAGGGQGAGELWRAEAGVECQQMRPGVSKTKRTERPECLGETGEELVGG